MIMRKIDNRVVHDNVEIEAKEIESNNSLVEMVEIHPDSSDGKKEQPKKLSFIDRIKKVFFHEYEDEFRKY